MLQPHNSLCPPMCGHNADELHEHTYIFIWDCKETIFFHILLMGGKAYNGITTKN